MTAFRDFTLPLWQIFGGNALMLATLGFYIAWWTASFRPNQAGRTDGAIFFITAAGVAGLAAVILLSAGVSSLPQTGRGIPVTAILAGAAISYAVLLAVTLIFFKRVVTSELILIIVWAALESTALAALYGSGRFSLAQAAPLVILLALATLTGLVCYVIHYRLDEIPRFWNGLIPLAADGGVVAVFLVLLALS